MNNLGKVLISIFSVIIVALTGILIYCFWPAITGTVKDTKYYTYDEVQNSYNNGYADGCKTEEELIGQVDYYRSLVDDYYTEVSDLNLEISRLTGINNGYVSQIQSLTAQITTLNNTISSFDSTLEAKDIIISEKNVNISDLQEDILSLNQTLVGYTNQLQTNNSTITSLNAQISTLNARIASLEQTISLYDTIANAYNFENKRVATFSVDNTTYNVQVLPTASIVSVSNPTALNYIFNGWLVDGELVDLSTYTLDENTTFVADLTFINTVNFIVDGSIINTQTVSQNEFADLTNVVVPELENLDFMGWSIDGLTPIEISTFAITENVSFIAVYQPNYSWELKTFNGNNYRKDGSDIFTDGTNIYSYTYSSNGAYYCVLNQETETWELVTFSGLSTQMLNWFEAENVWTDGIDVYYSRPDGATVGHSVLNKETRTWSTKFYGTGINFAGQDLWSDGTNLYASSSNKQFVYNYETRTWSAKTWVGLASFQGRHVWTDGTNIYYSYNGTHYVLDKETSTWTEKTINGGTVYDGLTHCNGNNVWNYGNNTFYSYNDYQYIFDKATDTWLEYTWNGFSFLKGFCVWTDGTHIYHSYDNVCYMLV